MIAVRDGRTIRVSCDIAKAMAGFAGGYRVVLHGLPRFTFEVDAPSGDDAQRACLHIAQKEGRCLKDTGCTFQAR